MKFTIPRSELLPGLLACATVAEAKASSPSYTCALVDVTPAEIRVHGTNGPQAVGVTVPLRGTPMLGRAMVNAEGLLSRARAMADGDISISTNDRVMELRQGRRRFTLSLAELAFAPKSDDGVPVGATLNGGSLAALLTRIAPAICTDTSVPAFYGVHLRAADGKLTAMASNNRSLARASVGAAGSLDVVMPPLAVTHVRKLFANTGVEIVIGMVGKRLVMDTPRFRYSTLLTLDAFPDVAPMVPGRSGPVILIPRGPAAAAIDALRTTQLRHDRVCLRGEPRAIVLHGRSTAGDEGEDVILGDGEIESVAMSATELAHALSFFCSDEVALWHQPVDTLSHGSIPRPVVIRETDSEDFFMIGPMLFEPEDLAPLTRTAA